MYGSAPPPREYSLLQKKHLSFAGARSKINTTLSQKSGLFKTDVFLFLTHYFSLAVSSARIYSPFSKVYIRRASNSLYRTRHNFYNIYFLLALFNVSFFNFYLFIVPLTGMFERPDGRGEKGTI